MPRQSFVTERAGWKMKFQGNAASPLAFCLNYYRQTLSKPSDVSSNAWQNAKMRCDAALRSLSCILPSMAQSAIVCLASLRRWPFSFGARQPTNLGKDWPFGIKGCHLGLEVHKFLANAICMAENTAGSDRRSPAREHHISCASFSVQDGSTLASWPVTGQTPPG